jgi:hypothetical protein
MYIQLNNIYIVSQYESNQNHHRQKFILCVPQGNNIFNLVKKSVFGCNL